MGAAGVGAHNPRPAPQECLPLVVKDAVRNIKRSEELPDVSVCPVLRRDQKGGEKRHPQASGEGAKPT